MFKDPVLTGRANEGEADKINDFRVRVRRRTSPRYAPQGKRVEVQRGVG